MALVPKRYPKYPINTLIANILSNIANQYPIGANPNPSKAKPAKIVENNGANPN